MTIWAKVFPAEILLFTLIKRLLLKLRKIIIAGNIFFMVLLGAKYLFVELWEKDLQ
jgi:hypothetical protein